MKWTQNVTKLNKQKMTGKSDYDTEKDTLI